MIRSRGILPLLCFFCCVSLPTFGASVTWTGAVDGNWDTTTQNWKLTGPGTPTTYTEGDTVLFDDTGITTAIVVQGGGVAPASITFNNTTNNYTLSGGAIGGTGGLTKQGTETVTLSAANTYSGLTTINAGRVNASAINALGGTGSGTIVASGATLGLNGAGITYAAEPVALNGGTLENLSGNNTFPGGITLLAASAITTTAGTPTWSGSIDNGGFLLTFSTAAATTASGILSGAGGLSKSGAGALTLSGSAANTYSGDTTVSAGTLTVSKDGALGAIAGKTTVAGGATLKFTVAYPMAEPVTINGAGDAGAGALWGAVNGTVAVPVTLGSAASILSTTNTLTLTGGIANAGFAVTVGGANNTTVTTSKITGTGGLTKDGAGTLSLNVANDYTGATTVNAGTLTAGVDGALGTLASGTTVATGATLAVQGGIIYSAEPLTLDGGTLSNAAGNNTWQGAVTLTLTATPTISCAASTTLVVSGMITGAGSLTKTTGGSLTLSNDTNDFTGAVSVNGGTLTATVANALGGIGSGTTVASTATLALQGGITYAAEPLALSNGSFLSNVSGDNTWQGTVTLTATPTLTSAANTLTVSGKITGASGFNKTGAGTVTLSNDTNDFTLTVAVNAGTLMAAVANALGATGGNTTVAAGATLALTGAGITYAAEPVSLGGGTLNNLSGNNTFPGNLTLTAASSLATTAGTPTWSGTIANGGFLLTCSTATPATISGTISGAGGLTKSGVSSLTLTTAHTYGGATLVSGGTLFLKDNGTALSSSGVTVNTGASLILDNTGTADLADRLGAVGLTLAGGTFQFKGANGAGSTETIGAVTLTGGSSTFINTPGAAGTAVLTGSSLTAAGGSLFFSGTLGVPAGSQVVFTAAPTLTPPGTGILPYATANDGTSTGFATYGANGIAVGGTGGVIDTAATGSDVVVSADDTMTKNRQTANFGALNSLTLVNDGTDIATDGGSYTLELSGGSLACYGNGCTIGANVTLDFTTANTTIFVDAGKTLTLAGPIAGSGSITKAGTGTLVLSANNTFTGTLNINAGKVTVTANGALGSAAGGTVVATGATLAFSGGISYSIAEAVLISGTGVGGAGALESLSGNNSFGGVITLASASTLGSTNPGDKLTLTGAIVGNYLKTLNCPGDLEMSGIIGGSGGLTKDGAGTLVLSGNSANGYTGVTTVNAGTVELRKPSGVVAITDDLVIGDGVGSTNSDVVRLYADNQIYFDPSNRSDVTVKEFDLLDLNGFSNIINSMTLTGGNLATGTGILTMMMDASFTVSGAGKTSSFSGLLTTLRNAPTLTVSSGATLDFSANLSVSSSLTKAGAGTLIFSGGQDNTNLSSLSITAGTVRLNKTPGKYSVSGSITVGNNTGTAGAEVLQLMAADQIRDTASVSVTSSGHFDLAGFADTMGSLSVTTGTTCGARVTTSGATLTLAGNVTLNTNGTPTIGATISGSIDLGAATRTFNIADGSATDDLLVSAVLSGAAGVGLTKTGAGRLTIASASTFAGTTTVSAGTLALKDAGTLLSSAAYTIAGGSLLLDESGTTPGNRLAGAAAVSLNSGALALQGKDNTASAQTVGEILLAGGNSTLTNTPGGGTGTSKLTGDRLTLSAGARLNCTGQLGTTDNQIRFTLAPALTSGMLPYATVAGADVATYNVFGIAPFGNYYTGIIDHAAATDNVRVTVNDTVTIPNKVINSLTILGDNVTVSSNPGVKLTLTSGSLKTSGTNQTVSVEQLKFGSDGQIAVDAGGLTVSSIVQGVALTKTGPGSLTLSGNNTYTGLTTIAAGTLVATVNNALGTADAGTIVADGATLTLQPASADLNYTTLEPLTLFGNGVGSNGALNSASYNNTFAGPISLASNASIGSATAAKSLTLSGIITESGGTRSVTTKSSGGSGILILSNAGNYWRGTTTISASTILRLGLSEVLPDKSAVTVTGTLELNDKSETVGSLAGAGTLQFGNGGANTFKAGGDNTTTTFSGVINATSEGSDSFIKTGLGNLTLSGNNAFAGKTNIEQGILTASHNNALGTATPGTEVYADATLAVSGGRTIPVGVGITLNGLGYGGTGALSNTSGNNTFQGSVTLASDCRIGVAVSTDTLTLSGAIGESGGSRTLTKVFVGVLRFTGVNTFTGGVIANGGTVSIKDNGTLGGISGLTVNANSTVTVDNTGTANNNDRINNAATVTLNGGTFNYLGRSNTASTETLGAVTVNAGTSTFNSQNGGGTGTTVLTSTSPLANVSGTVLFTGTFGTATNQILFTGHAPGAIGFATANDGISSGNAVYGSNGIEVTAGGVIDNAATASDPSISADDRMTKSRTTASGNGALNSLTLSGNGTDLLAGAAYTLELSSGALSATGGGGATLSTSANVTIDFGAVEGVISVASGTTLTINGPLAGSGGIRKTGDGTLILTAANTYTGNTTVVAGTLELRHNNALGAAGTAADATVQDGATLAVRNTITVPATKSLKLTGNGFGGVGCVHNVIDTNVIQGGVTLNADASIGSTTGTLTLSGVVGESGGTRNLAKLGAGALNLTAANTYSGTTTASAGTLSLKDAGTALSSTGFAIGSGGTLVLDNTGTANNNNRVNDTATLTLNGGTFSYLGRNNTASTETIGAVTVNSGGSTFNSQNGGGTGTTVMTCASLARTGGTLYFSGTFGTATNKILFTAQGAGLISYATAKDGATFGFATYGANGIAVSTGGVIDGALTGTDVIISADDTMSKNRQAANNGALNSLKLIANGTDVLAGAAYTLELSGGSLSAYGGSSAVLSTSANVSLDFGAIEAAIFVDSSTTLTINGPIAGSGGLRKTGAGTLVLAGPNTYTGVTTVAAGTLRVASASGTGMGSAAVTVSSGATLAFSGGMDYTKPITVGGGILHVESGNTTFSGDITLTASSTLKNKLTASYVARVNLDGTLNLTNGAILTVELGTGDVGTFFNGAVNGNGGIALLANTTGNFYLAGNNSFSGPFSASGGTPLRIIAQSATAFGSSSNVSITNGAGLYIGALVYSPTPLSIQGNGFGFGVISCDSAPPYPTLQGPITLTGDARIFLNSGGLTCTGNINASVYTLTLDKYPLTVSGNISGSGILLKTREGDMIFSGNNAGFTGITVIQDGTLYVNGTHSASTIVYAGSGTPNLAGTGTTGEVRMRPNSFVKPGSLTVAAATLTTGKMTMCPGSGLNIDLNGTFGSGLYDKLAANGDVSLGNATLTVSVGNGYVPATVDPAFPIVTCTGNLSGAFHGLPNSGDTFAAGGALFRVDYDYTPGAGKVTLTCVKQTTTTTLASSANPSALGAAATFTATVRGTATGAPMPAGNVTFSVDGTQVAIAALDGQGQAQFSTSSIPLGTHAVVAAYVPPADPTRYSASTSTALSQDVGRTETTLAASVTTLTPSDPITLTATVTTLPAGAGTATGTVTFKDGATVLGTGGLNGSGIATLVLNPSNLATGLRSLKALYGGATSYQGSLSPILYVTVNDAGGIHHYHITSNTSQVVNVGWAATLTAHDSNNNVVASDNSTVVTLSDDSPNSDFYSNATYTQPKNTVTLYHGQATIYMKDSAAETVTLSASDATGKSTAAPGSTAVVTVSASGPGVIDHYHISAPANSPIGTGFTATLTAHDAGHSVASHDSMTEVYLSSTGNGKFYTDNSYLQQATSTILSSGTATLYLKDSTVETILLTVEDPNGKTTASAASVDIILPINTSPAINSNGGGGTAGISVTDGSTAVTTVTATDGDGDTLTYSIVSGADAAKFSITSSGGVLTFKTGPVFATPTDADANNIYEVTVQAWDGRGGTDTQAISVTVTGGSGPPTISNIADLSTPIDTPTDALVFTVGDAVTPAASLTLQKGSSNTTLVPLANIVFGGSGANRTVTVTPAAGQTGTSTITVTVQDGDGLTANDTFILTVSNLPTISDIANQTTALDTPTGALPFTVGDTETAAASLTLQKGSSNTTLIPLANIVFGGAGANRTVTITPAAGQSGTSTITVTVQDGAGLTASDTFVLTVNGPPSISDIANQATASDTPTGAIAFTVGDTETPAASLTLAKGSSNTTLVPLANIVFGGSGANRTVTLTPAAGQTGTSTITITVQDGDGLTANDTFVLTVTNTPTISNIADQATPIDTPTGAIAFTVGDTETAAGALTLAKGSSNTTLIPLANIVFGGAGANRKVTITPAAGQTGSSTITVTVQDGDGLTASDTFVLSVNGPPTISNIADLATPIDTPTGALAFTVGDMGTAVGSLTLAKGSSNQTLVPLGNIVFGGSGANRTVTVTPAAGQTGSSTISVTVQDGDGLTANDTFVLTVSNLPTISNIADQTTAFNTATGALAFTIGDIETAAASLTLAKGSSNTTLVPLGNIVFGGSGANRTVTLTPASGQSGTSTITVTVQDGDGLTASDTFVLTVNGPPTISDITDRTTASDTPTGAIAFTVGDLGTPVASLTLSAGSSNTALIPLANIVFGGSGANRTVSVTPAAGQSGSSTITVTVQDGDGLTASDTFVLTVSPPPPTNQAPSITSGPTASPSSTHTGNNIVFQCAATDGDGDTLTYGWDFGDGTTGSGATAVHSYTVAGIYPVKLTLSDGKAALESTVTVTIAASGDAGAPVLTLTVSANPNPVEVGSPALFSAAATDPDGTKPTLAWDFGDGQSAGHGVVFHTYAAAGTYLAVATASDADGHQTAEALLVTVTEASAGGTATTADGLQGTRATVSLKFNREGADTIKLSGMLEIPEGFVAEGTALELDFGGVTKTFTLDAKGQDRSDPNARFKLTVKYLDGAVVAGPAKLLVTLKRGSFRSALEAYGLRNADYQDDALDLPVAVTLPDQLYLEILTGPYSAKLNRSGRYSGL